MFKYNSNKKRDIFFSLQRHVGTSCARSDFLFHKKSITCSTVPPFPQKVPLRLRCSLVNALATLRLATNFLRVQVYFKIFCRHLFCLPLYTSEQGPLCSDLFFACGFKIRHPPSPFSSFPQELTLNSPARSQALSRRFRCRSRPFAGSNLFQNFSQTSFW